MAVRLGAMVAVLLLAVLGLPQAASAQEVALVGVVVRVDAGQDTLWVQESASTGPGRVWSVRISDISSPGVQPALGIQAGDVVEVRGLVYGANALLARTISIRSRGSDSGILGSGIVPGPGIGGRGQRVEIDGVIISMDRRRPGVLEVLDREHYWRGRGQTIWTVRLTALTRVDGQRDGRPWDDRDGSGILAAGRLLHAGDRIKVEGRLIAASQILAEEIKVRGRGGMVPRPLPFPQPTPLPPHGRQTVILAPQAGTEVSGSGFTVVGRTVPGARVQVRVQARWSVFSGQVANATVTADQSGIFVVVIRPSMRASGTMYTITVTSTYQGTPMTPVSVTVRQI